MESIFDHKSQYSYLSLRLNQRGPGQLKGIKTRFASQLRIQPAYLSQVLAQKYALSLEQADLANQFFDHSSEESEFFLLLVSHDRAGTASLRNHFETQIASVLKRRQLVVERLGRKMEISDEVKSIYYSSWLYSAMHIGCTIPRLRTRKAVAQELSISTEQAGKILDFLENNSLLKKQGGEYLTTESWVRLDKESPHINKHHANWRQKAIQSIDTQTNEDLHYSGVFSMDAATAAKIKDGFLEYIKSQLKNIETAKEENLFTIGLDFFQVTGKAKD